MELRVGRSCPVHRTFLTRPEIQIALEQMKNDEQPSPGRRVRPARDDASLRRELRPSGPITLALREIRRPGVTIVEVDGELDLLTAPRMAALLDKVVRTRRHDDVVVDLRVTEFIDSAGLQTLLSAKRRLSRLSRELVVVSDSGPVRRVLELSRVIATLGVIAGPEDLPGAI
jgi:anti-sigma B factor antagonist